MSGKIGEGGGFIERMSQKKRMYRKEICLYPPLSPSSVSFSIPGMESKTALLSWWIVFVRGEERGKEVNQNRHWFAHQVR